MQVGVALTSMNGEAQHFFEECNLNEIGNLSKCNLIINNYDSIGCEYPDDSHKPGGPLQPSVMKKIKNYLKSIQCEDIIKEINRDGRFVRRFEDIDITVNITQSLSEKK